MSKHTTYEPPSGTKIEIDLEEIATERKPFLKRTMPLWCAALLVGALILLLLGGMWAESKYLRNYPDNPKAGLSI